MLSEVGFKFCERDGCMIKESEMRGQCQLNVGGIVYLLESATICTLFEIKFVLRGRRAFL